MTVSCALSYHLDFFYCVIITKFKFYLKQRLQKELANFMKDPVPGMSIDKNSIEGNLAV